MPDVTQPTSEAELAAELAEALSEAELAEVRAVPICGDKAHRHGGGGCHTWANANRITIARLLATLDQALARCERAEKRVEELEHHQSEEKRLREWISHWGLEGQVGSVQRDEASAALYSDAQPESDTGGA